jgi:hypothetical protein
MVLAIKSYIIRERSRGDLCRFETGQKQAGGFTDAEFSAQVAGDVDNGTHALVRFPGLVRWNRDRRLSPRHKRLVDGLFELAVLKEPIVKRLGLGTQRIGKRHL